MQLEPFDIIIFRKKNLMQSIYSMVTFDLDNHVGIIVEIDGKLYLNHFIIKNFRYLLLNLFFNTSYSSGGHTLTSVKNMENDEFYVYRSSNHYKCKKSITEILTKAENKLNYLNNFRLTVGFLTSKNIFNINIEKQDLYNHTCISYVLWFLNECELYSLKFINHDFYQKRINKFKGFKNDYKLVDAHNVGKKDLSKFNPYSLSYLLSFLENLIVFPFFQLTNIYGEQISWYVMIANLCIITPICTIHGCHSHKFWNWNGNGRRYIGVVITYVFLSIVLLEYNLKIEKNQMTYIAYLMLCPRIAMTRFASWLCNDIKGLINTSNKRPFDVALYESLWEGCIPTLFILVSPTWISYKTKNLLIIVNYSVSRFIIEFFKRSLLNDSMVTLGQVDSLLNFIIMYWYISFEYKNYSEYLFYFSLLFIFYLDTCFRFSLNKFNTTHTFGNYFKLVWKTSYNPGFYNGYTISENKYNKLIYPFPMLLLINYLLLQKNIGIYFFNCFSFLNIFERFVNGHVTDYLTIYLYKWKTYNLNFADLVINSYILYVIILFCY